MIILYLFIQKYIKLYNIRGGFEGRIIKKDTIKALEELQVAAKVNQDAQNYLTRIALYHKK